jgi:AcrR family transcriptional regulator
MDDIARQCNLAKPTLYYYYPSKESIFNEIVIDEARRFMDQVEKKIPSQIPADEKIAFFLNTYYHDLKKYSKELAQVPELLYESYPHGKPIVEKINEFFSEKLRPLLIEGKNQNILEINDIESTLSALVIMTDFLNLDWMRRICETDRNIVIERVIEILLNGIRRKKSYVK